MGVPGGDLGTARFSEIGLNRSSDGPPRTSTNLGAACSGAPGADVRSKCGGGAGASEPDGRRRAALTRRAHPQRRGRARGARGEESLGRRERFAHGPRRDEDGSGGWAREHRDALGRRRVVVDDGRRRPTQSPSRIRRLRDPARKARRTSTYSAASRLCCCQSRSGTSPRRRSRRRVLRRRIWSNEGKCRSL